MSQDRDLQLLLLEKITEVGERTARMEVEQRNMKEDLEKVKEQDEVQNKLLAEHISGVKTAKERLDIEIQNREDLQSRVSVLEEAPKFRATLKQYLLGAGGIAAAIAGILKVMKMLNLL